MYTTVLSTKGQLVMPAKIRKEDNLKAGTVFAVLKTPNGYELTKIPKNPIKALRGITKDLKIPENALKKMRMRDKAHDFAESNI